MELGLDPLRVFFFFFKSDSRASPSSLSPTFGIILLDYVSISLFILVIVTHKGLAWDRDTTVQGPCTDPKTPQPLLAGVCLGIALPKIACLACSTNWV